MPLGFGATVTGNASKALEDVLRRLQNTRPLVEKLAERSALSQRRNIDESHAPDGDTYPKLSKATLAHRGKGHPFGSLPLKDSGDMYESIHAEVRSDTVSWAGPHALDAYYFAYQNQGAPRANIPVRQFIGIASDDIDVWQGDAYSFAARAVFGG